MNKLTPESTLDELFEFAMPAEGVQTFPITLSNKNDARAKLMIVITGEANTANVIMANLMTAVQDMYDTAAQQAAEHPEEIDADDDGSPIIVP